MLHWTGVKMSRPQDNHLTQKHSEHGQRRSTHQTLQQLPDGTDRFRAGEAVLIVLK